jgi:hypothetical protein
VAYTSTVLSTSAKWVFALRWLFCVSISAVVLLCPCAAQKQSCTTVSPSSTQRLNGVTVHTVSLTALSEEGRAVKAHVLVPDADAPIPGIVFSHSAIHGLNSSADLLQFAMAIARAGAGSIVLDGTLNWETPAQTSRRPGTVMNCAAQYLVSHANIDLKRLAFAGPFEDQCGADPCRFEWFLDFGRPDDVESREITEDLLTVSRQSKVARRIQSSLHISEVKPEWLASEIHSPTKKSSE